MQTILIECRSKATAERAMPVAADLSAACGARLSLAFLPEPARALTPASGMDAVGLLSDTLFLSADRLRQPIRAFGLHEARSLVSAVSERVEDCWEAAGVDDLIAKTLVRRPDLVVSCNGDVARALVLRTQAPVWHVRPRQPERSWFLARKVRCAVRGSRAAEWARAFAAVLGAQVETTPIRLVVPDDVDLVVVTREDRTPLMGARAAHPVVVV
jgi:predicted RecB family endonuclease